MKRLVFVVASLWVFVCCNQGFAENTCNTCLPKSSEIDKGVVLRCLVGHMRLHPEDLEGGKQAVTCAIEEWKRRDGAIGSTISDTFLAMMEANAAVFFDVMANNELVFSEWLDKLRPLSFTWYKEPPSPLEERRKRLVEFLSKVGPLSKQQNILRQRLLSVLRGIKVRQVD